MPGRKFFTNASGYRYGYNGKELDKDISNDAYDYGMRITDQRLGIFLSVDPITAKYFELTPYQYASNRPIDGIDQDGLEYYNYGGTTIVHDNIPRVVHVDVVDMTMRKAAAPIIPDNVKKNEIAKTQIIKRPLPRITSVRAKPDGFKQLAEFEAERMARQEQIAENLKPENLYEGFSTAAKNYIEAPFREFDEMKSSFRDGNIIDGLGHAKNAAISVAPYAGVLKFGRLGNAGKLSSLQSKFDNLAESNLLPKYRELDINLKAGYTGSFKTGFVGNPNKSTFGQPVDLKYFDIDFYIESDVLFKRFGGSLKADTDFRNLLSETRGFEGLKPNKQGFSIKFKPSSK